ncbi:hypothetical protein MRB53_005845 [Persea americana]|uniref:Uncharacterized protein n=1 Tax=Persea americana TaxID=3435 RepID=A0ACC2ME98_PERAE|nr:hypothetical protein MRB53_005845 [Persea americana]
MSLGKVSLVFKRETLSKAHHSSLPLRTLSEVYPGTSFKLPSSAVIVQDVEWKRCGIGDAEEADAPPRRRPPELGTPRCSATLPKRDEQNTRDREMRLQVDIIPCNEEEAMIERRSPSVCRWNLGRFWGMKGFKMRIEVNSGLFGSKVHLTWPFWPP